MFFYTFMMSFIIICVKFGVKFVSIPGVMEVVGGQMLRGFCTSAIGGHTLTLRSPRPAYYPLPSTYTSRSLPTSFHLHFPRHRLFPNRETGREGFETGRVLRKVGGSSAPNSLKKIQSHWIQIYLVFYLTSHNNW